MKKRTIALLAAVIFIVSMFAGIGAADLIQEIKAEIRRDFTVRIDGDKQVFRNAEGDRVYPILYEGTTYLPLRAIGEFMGKTVYWDEGKKSIDLRTEDAASAPTVTDADVIYDSTDNNGKDKTEKTDKTNKPDATDKTVDKSEFISEDEAKKIALDKAELKESDVSFIKVWLDFDDGIWEYEVEIRNGRTEYDADIDALTGKILSWDVDLDD